MLAALAAIPWFAVPASPGSSRETHVAVRMRGLVHSRLAIALAGFFGLRAMQAYILVGWLAQYLRDAGVSAAGAGLLLGLNLLVAIPLNAVVPGLTVRAHLQRPLLLAFVAGYVAGWGGLWLAPLAAPWLWMELIAGGMASFSMSLTLIGLRARTPETTAALSTVAQGWGYLFAGAGPLLVGVLRGPTGGYTGMFVILLAGVAGLGITGWLATRQEYVDDEVPGWSADRHGDDVLEPAGTEAPVGTPVSPERDGSPCG